MFGTLTRTILTLSLTSAGAWVAAAGTSIGMAVTNGEFHVDHAPVWGNATLFDGSSIETATAFSQLRLNDGVVMRLAPAARATVYQRKLVLEQGIGQMEFAAGYEVEARSLHISPATNNTVTRISVDNGRNIQVAAIRGAVLITNATGLLVAKVEAGSSLSLEPQPGDAPGSTNASGCLLVKDGKWIMADQTTNVVLELQGSGLDQQTGNRVHIVGTAASDSSVIPGASQVIRVTEMKLIGKGGCGAIAKKLGGAGAGSAASGGVAGSAAASGIGTGAVAVIGGVASAAAVGGLAAAGTFSGNSSATPAASR
jgi:hypothetical protein